MKNIVISALIFFGFALPLYSGNNGSMISTERTKIFFTKKDITGSESLVVGKVLSFSTRVLADRDSVADTVSEKSRVTVRLYLTEGIKKGDTLYIIDRKNLVVARLKAHTLFQSNSFGMLLIGHGDFTQAGIEYRVVQKIEDEYSAYAYIHRARGDYYLNTGETGQAIFHYKKAIELDRGNPETHLALGNIYYNKGMYQFAFTEYQCAFVNIERLYDREDKFDLLRSMATVRYKEIYERTLPLSLKSRYRKEGIEFCQRALDIYPDSDEVTYMLGMFNYKYDKADDRKARDLFLKVITINPEHLGANIALSELYLKHKNKEKARLYAEKALKISPASKRARQLMLYIDSYTR